jgi:hypothetical protein
MQLEGGKERQGGMSQNQEPGEWRKYSLNIWHSTYGTPHMALYIWHSTYGTLHMALYIWDSTHPPDALFLRVPAVLSNAHCCFALAASHTARMSCAPLVPVTRCHQPHKHTRTQRSNQRSHNTHATFASQSSTELRSLCSIVCTCVVRAVYGAVCTCVVSAVYGAVCSV